MSSSATKGAPLEKLPAPGTDAYLLGAYKRAPMEFVRGSEVELFDADGKAYLDLASGIAVNALGYGDTGIRRAILDSLDTGLVHVSNLYRTAPGEELARALVRESFADKVFFCNSGAEANEGAFKFARRWGRATGSDAKIGIVALRGSFHGRLFGSLAATDRPSYRAPFRPLAGGISICERELHALDAALDGDSVAALILEPVQGESGVRVLEASFLHELRRLTSERGIALIFDEIQCGLGRLGTLFAYDSFGVIPDMVTLAKPMAGGLPMGAILVSSEIASTIKPGDHGTTFGGGPLVASVALEVLRRISDPVLLASVAANGAWLGGALRSMASRTGKIRAVRGMGYMWGIDVVERATDVIERGWNAGVLVISAGDHTIRLLPPLIMTREQLSRGAALLEQIIN
jgi:acetylornithine/N-succinyldiaminopimelate aminotransferase